jgi:hypothetical protein
MRFLTLLAVVSVLLVGWVPALRAQQRIPPTALADSLWQIVGQCSGAPIQPGGDLGDVKWYEDADRLLAHHARAEWVPPDTILLAPGVAPWEIAHELVHHRMRGPPDNAFTLGTANHPFNPFAYPCQLMPFQHQPGGIMASTRGNRR